MIVTHIFFQLIIPQTVLDAALLELNPPPDYTPETWDATGFPRLKDRTDGVRVEQFNFKMHIRELSDDEFFEEIYTVDVRAFIRLDQAPQHTALLKFFVNNNKADPNYVHNFNFEMDKDVWKGHLGTAIRGRQMTERHTNSTMTVTLPTETNDLVGGLGTLAMRVQIDKDLSNIIHLSLLIGVAKDQILGPDDVVIGYIENYHELNHLFGMVDSDKKRDGFLVINGEVSATIEFE